MELRQQAEAAERLNQGEGEEATEEAEEEDEEEDEEEAEEEAEAEAEPDDEGDDEGGDEDEDAPKKKKKKPVKPAKPKAKPRTRTPKIVRQKAVWQVCNNSATPVATYEYPKRKEAEEHAAKLTTDKKQTHFVQMAKVAIEEKKEG